MAGTHSEELSTKVKRIIDQRLGKYYQWPGNVRELEQCVRSVLLKKDYGGQQKNGDENLDLAEKLVKGILDRDIMVSSLVSGYCKLLYDQFGTYEQVAKHTGLDRRTIKKYIINFKNR